VLIRGGYNTKIRSKLSRGVQFLKKDLMRAYKVLLLATEHLDEPIKTIAYGVIAGIIVVLLYSPTTVIHVSAVVMIIVLVILFEFVFVFLYWNQWREAVLNSATLMLLSCLFVILKEIQVQLQLIDWIGTFAIISFTVCVAMANMPTREKGKEEKALENTKTE
jgi:predicted Kef-type K+ transport protein